MATTSATYKPATGTCMMFLRINGFMYKVYPLPILGGCRAFKLHKLAEDSDTVYTVQETNSGVQCDCEDFRIRRSGRGDACKHCKTLMTYGMLA